MLFNVKAFTFQDSFELLQAYSDISIEEAMKVCFILGGVPKYLLLAGEFGTASALRTFERLFLKPGMGKELIWKDVNTIGRNFFNFGTKN